MGEVENGEDLYIEVPKVFEGKIGKTIVFKLL